MPTQNRAELVSFQGWILRAHRSVAKPCRLLVLVHGRTGDEDSMWVFARNLPRDYWIVAPRAPYPALSSGYSWVPTSSGSGEHAGLDDLRTSADALVAVLDAYASQHQLQAHQFDIIGFSEGAALASTVALTYPGRIRRLAMLAGFVPDGVEDVLPSQPLDGVPVFVAHGTLDDLVGIDQAHRSVAMLQQAGAQVAFCEAEIGHKVSAACLRGLDRFFA